jgi:polar amino acid transport system permease protein
MLGFARLYGPRPLSIFVTFYIDSLRSIPVLAVIVWVYFALPLLTGINLPPFWAALVGLSLQVSAYMAEIVRAGLVSIRPGQTWAGLVLGMSRRQIIQKILLPQAIIRMLPAFGSLISITIKDTAIAEVIAAPDLMKRAETVSAQTFQPMEVFTVVMVVYFLILFPTTRFIEAFYRKLSYKGRS